MIKIDEFLNIWINDKELQFTIHIRNEIDGYDKDTLFVAEVIDKGEKKLVSKKENKFETSLLIGDIEWIVSYVVMDDFIIAIHLGKR